MPTAVAPRVFVSATTRDLGKCRQAVAESLNRAGCHVEVQDDFTAHGGVFVEKLRDYIRECDLVVCLVGEHFGWAPPEGALIESVARGAYAEPLVSASEWEYFLAIDAGCDLFLYLSSDGFTPDQPSDDTPEKAAAHRGFRTHVENAGRDCNRFTDAAKLPQIILEAFHLRALRKGGETRPRFLPKAAQLFTGRRDEVEWLKAKLRTGGRVALIGPGGIGKTAIAHEAAAALSPASDPFAVFPGGLFVHDFYAAPGHLAAIESINTQAGHLDLEDAQREAIARQSLSGARALVYLEGCEKAEDLPRFLDLCGSATVLITSRRADDGKGAAHRDIDPLAENEAAEMLRRHAEAAADDPGTLPAAADPVWREIAALLGRHPLALRLAGFRLGSGNETPAEYHNLLSDEGFAAFDDDRRTKESLDFLFTHSAEALSAHGRAAWFALSLHALAPIHLAPIAAALDVEEREARKALGELVRHSLADAVRMPAEQEGETEPAWLLAHALLPEWGRKTLAQHGVEDKAVFVWWGKWWILFLGRCFDAARVPGGPARYGALTEHFEALLANIEARTGAKSKMLTMALMPVGSVHHFMGRYVAAESCCRRDLAVAEALYGPEHPNTLASLNNLAVLLSDKGDLAGAEPLFRRAFDVREHVLGPEHPDTLKSLSNLANLLGGKGDLAGAEPLYRLALETSERVLGPEHPVTLGSLHNLALLLSDKGDLAGAEPLYRRALEARERVLGPEHPETLKSLHNLALLLSGKGDLAGAEPLFRRAFDVREHVLGPEHPDTLLSATSLAILLHDKGDLAGAESLARRAAEGFAKVLLPQHTWRQTAERVLAAIQAKRGG